MNNTTKGHKFQEYFVSNLINSKDFTLLTSYPKEGVKGKTSTNFILQSELIRARFKLSKNVVNLFAFITNNENLLFYIRKKPNEFLTEKLQLRFKNQIKTNSANEITINLNSLKDIDDLIQLLFIEHLKSSVSKKLKYSDNLEAINFNNELDSIILANHQNPIAYKEAIVKIRTSQTKYRDNLMGKWENKCGLTNISKKELLEACHIKPFCECDNNEYYDLNNGIILTPTIHKLFDKFLISFDNSGKIMLSKRMNETDLHKLNINENMTLNFHNLKMEVYLKLHRTKFLANEI
ncbi:HNH endonuclease [Lutibacter citreus]|uniref:HNH endonuclease n=1 Tax=Lutibacter citreus TaxID=2138210 RepID=UPI000DBEA8FE|nr:HNH endonuclease [Lutibacter citreus]